MTDSIKVVCRFRSDKEGEEIDNWEFDHDTKTIKLRDKKFTYDEILDMNTQQDEMYDKVATKTIEDFCNGYHGTLFAYGNSGSGKTYSIVGPDEIVEFLAKDFSLVPENIQKLYGVIPRATIAIFNAINEYTSSGATCSLSASYIEIYNETITCLLNQKENLKVQEIPKVGFAISGKEDRPCLCPEDIFKVLYIGTKNKTIGGTLQNARSSRSHTLLSLEMKIKTIDGSERQSKLNIVDLAGSEKLKNTGASTPERIKEAQKINLSLTTLGMCIMALTENANFVPFRNSKLTLLLKESLGGNSKTTLLCAARRDKKLVDDNLNSLYFAQRAKAIKTKCVKNVKLSDKESEFLLNALKAEIVMLRRQVKELGHTFKPITDPKLLKLLEGDIKDELEGETEHSGLQSSESLSQLSETSKKFGFSKRTSIINLSEEEIIMKYCELKAKYDNLIENAGNKIFELQTKATLNPGANNERLDEITKKHLEELEQQKAENQEQISKKIAKIEELEKEKKKLFEELQTSQDDSKGLQDMLDMNASHIENMNQAMEEKENELKVANNEKLDLKNQIKIKEEEVKSRDTFIEEVQKQNSELEKKNKELEAQASLVKERDLQIQLLLEEVANLKNVNSDLNKKVQVVEETNNQGSQQIIELKARISELESSSITKDSTITNLTSEVENLRKIEKDKISDQDLFAQKDKLYNETKKVLEDRIAQLNEQNLKTSKANADSLLVVQNELNAANSELSSLKSNFESLAFELKSKTVELENTKALNSENLKSKEEELTAKSNDLNEAKTKVLEKEKEFHQKLLKLDEDSFAYKTKITELEDKINSSAKELDKVKTSKENEILALTKDRDTKVQEINDLKEKNSKLEQNVESLEKRIVELKNQLNALQTDNKRLDEVKF